MLGVLTLLGEHVTLIQKGAKQLHLVFEVKSQKESFLVMIENKNGEKLPNMSLHKR